MVKDYENVKETINYTRRFYSSNWCAHASG